MKISVIIPVYNVATYLAQCLDSVINQTFTDLQIIVIDDGSTDDSGKICDEYAAKDKRIEVYHRKNSGISTTLNFGLSVAKGEYIAQVDSDDALHPKMYEMLYNTMKLYDADMTCCKWSCDENVVKTADVNDFTVTKVNPVNEFEYFFHETECFRWNKLCKKELFADFHYPDGHVSEDQYIHRIVYQCSNAIIIDLPLYYYRMREGSYVHTYISNIEKRFSDSFFAFDDRIAFADEHNWSSAIRFFLIQYCDRAIWLHSVFRNYKTRNVKLESFCRDKIRKQLTKHKNVKIPLKYRLWNQCIGLYDVYVLFEQIHFKIRKLFNFIFCWEKNGSRALRIKVESFIRLGFIKKIKNKKDDVVACVTVSSTSLSSVYCSLFSLFRQKCKPDKIILLLSESSFSDEDVKKDNILCKIVKKGLSVKFYKECNGISKFSSVFKDFPISKVVVCDGSFFYPKKWLQKLIKKEWCDSNSNIVLDSRGILVNMKDCTLCQSVKHENEFRIVSEKEFDDVLLKSLICGQEI